MIEPAGYGAALLFGPNTWNFKDIVAALLQHQAATVVRNQAELEGQLTNWLRNPEAAREQGGRAQEFVLSQRGATLRTAELLMRSLDEAARSTGKAA